MSNALTGLADRLLDLTIAPGYTRVGMTLRRTWWPEDPAPDALAGRTVAVTGSNSGLGEATALGLARLGARVLMLCRTMDKAEAAKRRIEAKVPGADLVLIETDVADLDAVEQVAEKVLAVTDTLHALVHNAGVMPPERSTSPQDHEMTLAVHVLGPHKLTYLLRHALAADGDGRVVWMSSGGMYSQKLREDDLQFTDGEYDGVTAYARTKRMQVHLAERWARELADLGVSVHSAHPGWADTPGVQDSLPGFYKITKPFLRDAAEGADTVVWLAASPRAGEVSGEFWQDRAPRPTAYLGLNQPSADQTASLWRQVVDLTGVPSDA
ncbi:SDR family NAD(P)-dependent oxidoreductase [Nocardioidaceae bacterium]|nr:SDR family NAD(P)-dependent oxidoreductase [Nocardioidaceae bacterium]